MAAVQSKAWDQVSEKFEALSAHLRDRFDEVGADATADREAFEKSLRTLASALEDTLTTAGRAVRDPVLRKDLTSLAVSLREALLSTWTSTGDLRDRLTAPVRRGRSAVTGRGGRTAKETTAAAKAAATKAAAQATKAATTAAATARTKAAETAATTAKTARTTGARTVSRTKSAASGTATARKTGTSARKAAPRKSTKSG